MKNIYVFGGEGDDDYLKHCEMYSILNDEWTEIASLGKKKESASACIFNNQFIYVIGGYFPDDGYILNILRIR